MSSLLAAWQSQKVLVASDDVFENHQQHDYANEDETLAVLLNS